MCIMKRIVHLLILSCICSLLFVACKEQTKKSSTQKTAFNRPPSWAKDQIWYQIFVESFRNGDPSNDPTPIDLIGAHPGYVPEGWHVTSWGHDWYKPEDYAKNVIGKKDPNGWPMDCFGAWSQIRRYGGDLQGVLDKIAYLDSLGITAIYFNPLNDAPSNHKYNAANWRHIDRNFGPNPAVDRQTMANEQPQDTATWKWTEADKLFLKVINECHKRGIKVVMDYSWNHVGTQFWAWKDVVKNQSNSAYKDWFNIKKLDDPTTKENEFDYSGWANMKSMPEIKKTVHVDQIKRMQYYEGNYASQAAKNHIFAVTRKWLDPNGDGDPSDGVDGYRMDVAVEIPMGFWRDFRKVVRSVNPEAYLVAECWWEVYPDHLIDPAPFLQGDMFDAVMNYRGYRAERGFFGQTPDQPKADAFVDSLNSFLKGFPLPNSYAMMNVNGTHDSPRLLTSLENNDRKYKVECEWNPTNKYKVGKPSERAHIDARLLLAMQYTYIGAPHIWMGDEMGMWGADMASSRKPLLWEDYTFEPETVLDAKHSMTPVTPVFDHQIFDYYKRLITIRKQYPVLRRGKIKYLLADDSKKLLAYSRYGIAEEILNKNELDWLPANTQKDEVIVAFNKDNQTHTITLPTRSEMLYRDLLQQDFSIKRIDKETLEVVLPAQSVVILATSPTYVVQEGKLDVYRDFPTKLVTPRDLFVWTPNQYDPSKHYPVIYMHDGQMLWDASTSWNKQEWMIDEEMQRCIDEGKVPPCIVVATASVPGDRFFDYYPQKTNNYLLKEDSTALAKLSTHKFSADNYLKYLVEEVKPFVDSHYATKSDVAHTGIMGSSMGGLISLYALCEYPDVFSRAACMSTHSVMIAATPEKLKKDAPRFASAFRKYLKAHLPKANSTHRIYMDRGDQTLDAQYPDYQNALDNLMQSTGWKAPYFETKVFPGHAHMEADWCKRLENPFTFLLTE